MPGSVHPRSLPHPQDTRPRVPEVQDSAPRPGAGTPSRRSHTSHCEIAETLLSPRCYFLRSRLTVIRYTAASSTLFRIRSTTVFYQVIRGTAEVRG